MADFYENEIFNEFYKFVSSGDEKDDSNLVTRRSNELISIVTAFYSEIDYLKISNILVVPYNEDHQVELDFKDCAPVKIQINIGYDYLKDDQFTNIGMIEKLLKQFVVEEKFHGKIAVLLEIILDHHYPQKRPESVSIIKSYALSNLKLHRLKELIELFLKSNKSNELLLNLISEVKSYLRLFADIDDTDVMLQGEFAAADVQKFANINYRLTGPGFQKNLSQISQSKQKSRAVFSTVGQCVSIKKVDIELNDLYGSVLSADERVYFELPKEYQFTLNSSLVNLSLLYPKSVTSYFSYSKLKFVIHRTDFEAFNCDLGKKYRLSLFIVNLSPIRNEHCEFFLSFYPYLQSRLKKFESQFAKQFFSLDIDSNSEMGDTLSTYVHYEMKFPFKIEEFKHEPSCRRNKSNCTVQFILVKEAYPQSTGEGSHYFSLEEIKKSFFIGKPELSFDKACLYTVKLLKSLNFLHSNGFFHGEFALSKIFLSQNGNIKLFDSFLDTYVSLIIPMLIEKEVEIKSDYKMCFKSDSSSILDSNLFWRMKNNDVYNFGSFVGYFFTNLQFQPVLNVPNEPLDIVRFNKLLLKQIKKIDDYSVKDMIVRCIEVEEIKRPALHTLFEHPFVKEFVNKPVVVDQNEESEYVTVNSNTTPQSSVVVDTIDEKSPLPSRFRVDFYILDKLGSGKSIYS